MPAEQQTPTRPFNTVLVANRGEIACRIIRTLRDLGVRPVAVFTAADSGARHVQLADVALRVDDYLDPAAMLAAAVESGADAIHPGYGFLSENADFAARVAAADLVFIGPGVTALTVMGDKIRAKTHVARSNVPVIPGIAEPGLSDAALIDAAASVGFPLLVKPSAGGGGKGMYVVSTAEDLPAALSSARRVAARAFGDDTLFLERLIDRPRHIEVQVLADNHGTVIHLGERECSLQRRHQKVIEESPSPLLAGLPEGDELRARMGEAACAAARSVEYSGAGTVEFLVSDAAPDEFYFMEMNTRLQVEHPVTELVTGIDIVAWQLRIAAGERLTLRQDDIRFTGHAIEARVYAEDPAHGFLPSTGTVLALHEPSGQGIRVDSALMPGLEIGGRYDPMLAKVIAWGAGRTEALSRLDTALAETVILGVPTNVAYLRALLADTDVVAGRLDTGLIERMLATPAGTGFTADADFRAVAGAAARERMPAAVALYLHLSAWEAADSAWHRPTGWRLGRHRPVRYRLEIDAAEVVVQVSGEPGDARVTVGEGTAVSAAIRRIDGEHDRFTVEVAGAVDVAQIVDARDGQRTVWIAAGQATASVRVVSAAERLAARRSGNTPEPGVADPQLRAPMPGTVTNVSVADGDSVDPGAAIVTIEAMKMEHTLVAALAGIVRIAHSVGDVVSRGQVLATIESAVPAASSQTPNPGNPQSGD